MTKSRGIRARRRTFSDQERKIRRQKKLSVMRNAFISLYIDEGKAGEIFDDLQAHGLAEIVLRNMRICRRRECTDRSNRNNFLNYMKQNRYYFEDTFHLEWTPHNIEAAWAEASRASLL